MAIILYVSENKLSTYLVTEKSISCLLSNFAVSPKLLNKKLINLQILTRHKLKQEQSKSRRKRTNCYNFSLL